MPRTRSVGPTEGELEILQILWRKKAATAREVYESIGQSRPIQPTTIRTMMRLMVEKKLIVPEGDDRPQKFRAVEDADTTREKMLKTLAKRFFGGSPKKLLMHILSKKATK